MSSGIEFSVAVAVGETSGGKLLVELPRQVAERLSIGSGDVLCWTGFESGEVEVWSVRKSPYTSLDAQPRS